ncbi:MAG: methyl-accepting chemotaxis protein, partial [Pseudomonadota bacterium]
AAAVEEQGAATRDIAQNINQAADLIRNVSSNVEGVAVVASHTGDNADNVLKSVAVVNDKIKYLQEEIANFLSDIAKA